MINLDNAVWEEKGYVSRPSKENRREYLETITKRIKKDFDVKDLKANYDYISSALEQNNQHSLGTALDIIVGRTTIEEEMAKEKEAYGY